MRFSATVNIEVDEQVIQEYYEGDDMAARVDFLDALNNWAADRVDGRGRVVNAWTKSADGSEERIA
jgi:hypothetical protein